MTKTIKIRDQEYVISNNGILFNPRTNRYLKPSDNGKGYLAFNICKDGKNKRFLVSRLVATHFVSNPNNHPVVNHDDGNKLNNYYKNLIWDTHSGNIKHAIRTGLIKLGRRKISGRIKSKPVIQLDVGGNQLNNYPSISEAARVLNIDSRAISKVCLGKQKTAYGFKWRFKV